MGARALLVLTAQFGKDYAGTSGTGLLDLWEQTLREEVPTDRKPLLCADCPLAPGGVLAESAAAAAPTLLIERFSCHADHRPCATAVRLARKAGRSP